MDQPPGFIDANKPDYVCKLKKAIYRLKQAPRTWYNELRSFLLSLGFVNSLADTSLFILRHETQTIYLLIYVDDILITGNTPSGIARVLTLLAERFSVKDAEDLNYFLGIEAHRTPQGLHLSQRKYILDLLRKYSMTNAKPVTTPMASSPKLHLNSGVSLSRIRQATYVSLGAYNTYNSPGWTLHTQSTNYHNSCISQLRIIGKLPNGFFDTSREHQHTASSTHRLTS